MRKGQFILSTLAAVTLVAGLVGAVSARNHTGSAEGTLRTFPSGLIYSVRQDFNGTSSLVMTLKATSLPLTVRAAAPAEQVGSIGVGAGVAVSAIALGLGVQMRRRKNRTAEKKPEYWVD